VIALRHRASTEKADLEDNLQDLGVVRTIQMPVSLEDLLRAVEEARASG
jgi:hypothetical protein